MLSLLLYVMGDSRDRWGVNMKSIHRLVMFSSRSSDDRGKVPCLPATVGGYLPMGLSELVFPDRVSLLR